MEKKPHNVGTDVGPGQLKKIAELFMSALRDKAIRYSAREKIALQKVVEVQGWNIAHKLAHIVAQRVENMDKLECFTPIPHSDRITTSEQMLAVLLDAGFQISHDDFDRKISGAKDFSRITFCPNKDSADVFFFRPGYMLNYSELRKEYAVRNLVPAHPYSLASINSRGWANKFRSNTVFHDAEGNLLNMTCHKNSTGTLFAGIRTVGTSISFMLGEDDYWQDDIWFAGVNMEKEAE